MLRIKCPFCGERNHNEFSYGGDASIKYPALDAPLQAWHDAVFLRENICGRQLETWQHVHGCRMWLVVERDTQTHEIFSVRAADEKMQAFSQTGSVVSLSDNARDNASNNTAASVAHQSAASVVDKSASNAANHQATKKPPRKKSKKAKRK